jgi:tetratricopeptide (TPR) repeat protein
VGERRGDLKGRRQIQAFREIEDDIENVRAAWRYYLDQRNTLQLWKFIYSLWMVYWIRWWNHAGMELFAGAVRALDGAQDRETMALHALAGAFQSYFMGWLDLAQEGYELTKASVQVLEEVEHYEALAYASISLVLSAYFLTQHEFEFEASNIALKIAHELDDRWLIAYSTFAVVMGLLSRGNYPEARRLAEKNLNLNVQIGDVVGECMTLITLGDAALVFEEFEKARGYYQRCLDISLDVDFYYGIQTARKYLGKVMRELGRLEEAEEHFAGCLRITHEIGFMRDVVNMLYEFARLRDVQGNKEEAIKLLVLVLDHPASKQPRMFEGQIDESARELLSTIEGELPGEAYKAAMEQGQELDLDKVVSGLVKGGNYAST